MTIIGEAAPDGSITLFACRRGTDHLPRCTSCGGPAELRCRRQLRGRRAGEVCGRPVCLGCVAAGEDGVEICAAHARQEGIAR